MSVAPPPSPLGSPQVRGVLYQSWPQPDGTLRLVYLSDNAEDLLETSAEDLARMALTQTLPLIHPDPAAFYRSIVESARNHTPWAADFGFITPRTGRHLWLRAQDFPLRTPEGIPYFSGVLLDITHVKETERQLAKAYQILSSHLDNTPLGVVEWDANGLVIRWSNQCEKIFGWPASAVLGKKPSEWNFIPPEDWEQVVEAWGRLSTGTDRRSVTRSRNLHQDGRLVHCEWHNSVQTDEHGTVVSVLSLVMDLTEETQARELASRSENRLRTALQYAGMLGWDYDFRAKEVYYSTDLGEYYGAPELVGYQDPDSELRSVHPEDRERVGKEFQKAIEGCGEMRAEFRGVASGPDGNPRWFVTRARVFPGPDRHPVQIIGVTTDVTDRKQAELEREALEKELQESRKRESLGLLAGGIAHDFNNILTIILGNVGVARGAVGPDSPATRSLREIEDASHRAADLCRQFAAFAGTGRFVSENMDLSTVLRDAEPVLATALRAGVSLRLELEDSLPLITADPFQIRQMILNLVLNGSEAAPAEGGWVRIRTSHTVIPASGTEPGYTPHIPAGEYVAIDVTDNGHGMDEPTRSKVFDPFFTTKSTGRQPLRRFQSEAGSDRRGRTASHFRRGWGRRHPGEEPWLAHRRSRRGRCPSARPATRRPLPPDARPFPGSLRRG